MMIVYYSYSDCPGSTPAPDVHIGGLRWSDAHAETRCLRTSVALVLTHAFSFAFLSYWSFDCITFVTAWVRESRFGDHRRQRAHYAVSVLRESAVESRFCRLWTNQQVLCTGHSHRLNVAGRCSEADEQQSQWAFGNVDNCVAIS